MLSTAWASFCQRLATLVCAPLRRIPAVVRLAPLRAIARDRRGGTAVLVGIGAPAIIGGLALSIDVGLWYLEKRKLQQISDTASLGAVSVLRSGGSPAAARSVALNDAKRNGFLPDGHSDLAVNIPPLEGSYAGNPDAVEVVASRRLPLLFSGFFLSGGKSITARSVALHSSAAASTPRKNIEVSLILDVSTSMAQRSEIPGMTKIQAVQSAAKKVVEAVVQSQQEPYSTRVSIVPYGSAVAVGDAYYSLVTGTTSKTSDVIERTGASAFSDDAPGPGKYFPAYTPKTKKGVKDSSNEKQHTSKSVLSPLSADKEQLAARIDSFVADGKTAGHIGLAWAWNTLSPKWSDIWPVGNAATAYDSDRTTKIAVLMSDFNLTVTYAAENGTASDQAMTLCTKMKEAGIVIYTVGYQVPSGNMTAAKLWNGCASDSDKVYRAETVDQLVAAFSSIAAAAQGTVAGPKLVE